MIKISVFLVGFLLAFNGNSGDPKETVTSSKTSASSSTNQTPPISINIPFEQYTLANGLNVILSKTTGTSVSVSTWYKVGAKNETVSKTGLAHLFEHLMFEGSKHIFPKYSDYFALIESVGGKALNASTGFEHTNYYQTVPKDQLELVLALESDRMKNLLITLEKLKEQQEVVMRERQQRIEVGPYGLANLFLWQQMFPKDHSFYGRVIGSHEDLQNATIHDVQAFYDKFYGPSNASLAIVGNFDTETTKQLITKYYGGLAGNQKIEEMVVSPLQFTKETVVHFNEPIGKLPLVKIVYSSPKLYAPSDAELDLLDHILTGTENGLLTRKLTRDPYKGKVLANTVSAYQQSFKDLSFFSIEAILNEGVKEADAIDAIDQVLADLAVNLVHEKALMRARNLLLTTLVFGLQVNGGPTGKAEILQSYWRYANDPGFMEKDLKRYNDVTRENIRNAVKNILPVKDKRFILIANPEIKAVAKAKGNN